MGVWYPVHTYPVAEGLSPEKLVAYVNLPIGSRILISKIAASEDK